METQRNRVISNFRESAVRVFLNLWFDFEKKVRSLNRQEDNNLFDQLQSRYTSSLKVELLKHAEICLSEYCGDRSSLRKNLNDQVAQNISAFITKARLL
ncbi:hypothetical protein LZZ85_12365 [Terrimonas sp. NA20]|uniref:Uncharacterized protein n=1 Tax=Terrimonas ginsenosidimutans TaxID=2908004 RepID=A0ABS9KS03_9BACT|nr:hypothetical protein [Terrimonas ginsenosidimutans]MCG2615084.1 hypothetical protein [Terrimonas ginsenosidimutans]